MVKSAWRVNWKNTVACIVIFQQRKGDGNEVACVDLTYKYLILSEQLCTHFVSFHLCDPLSLVLAKEFEQNSLSRIKFKR